MSSATYVALLALLLSLFELVLWVGLLLFARKLAAQARPMLAMFAPPASSSSTTALDAEHDTLGRGRIT